MNHQKSVNYGTFKVKCQMYIFVPFVHNTTEDLRLFTAAAMTQDATIQLRIMWDITIKTKSLLAEARLAVKSCNAWLNPNPQ